MHDDVIRIRHQLASDRNFILNSWLKSFRTSPTVSRMENAAYFHEQSKVIHDLLDHAPMLVASDPKDPDNIYGYISYQFVEGHFVLHYLYVKHAFRSKGLGKYLIQKAGHEVGETAAFYTHHTKVADKSAYKFRFIFNPYITRYFKSYIERDQDAAS